MPDHHPRYVVREQHGTTVGEYQHSWDFLILDSWYGYAETLWVKPRIGQAVHTLRRRVYEYAALLNQPHICACGCGDEVSVGPFAGHQFARKPRYASAKCRYRAKHRREQENRGRLA